MFIERSKNKEKWEKSWKKGIDSEVSPQIVT
jgi:hypothetical protein